MGDVLQLLLALQDYDGRKLAIQRAIQDVPSQNQKIDDEIQQIQQQISDVRQNLIDQKKRIHSQEQKLADLEKTLEQDRYQLPLTKNLTAHQALANKIDRTESQIAQIEDETLKMLVDAETLEREAPERIAQLEAAIVQKLSAKIATAPLSDRAAVLEQKINTLREVLAQESPELLNLYNKTRQATKRMPCIVRETGNSICAGCHLKQSQITPQTVDSVKFYICESCGCMNLLEDKNSAADSDEDESDTADEPEFDSLGYRKIRYPRRKQ